MKTFYIYGRYVPEVRLPASALKLLQQKLSSKASIGLCSSIQFISHLNSIAAQLSGLGFKAELIKGFHSHEKGQVLGCDMPYIDGKNYDCLLYIGDGVFHPKGMQLHAGMLLITYNPIDQSIEELKRDDAERLLKRHKAAMGRFLLSEQIGVLITLKAGQNRMRLVRLLEKKYPDKKFYPVVFDSLAWDQLENFPFVQCWVNTMCPRIGLDDTNKINKPIVNIVDLLDMK